MLTTTHLADGLRALAAEAEKLAASVAGADGDMAPLQLGQAAVEVDKIGRRLKKLAGNLPAAGGEGQPGKKR